MRKEIVVLLRVSTTEQTVENQKHQIETRFEGYHIHFYIEEGVSGKTRNADRPTFRAATRHAKKLNVPLVAAFLSRFGRDLAEISTWYRDNVIENNLEIIALDHPNLDPETAGFHFTIQQIERIKISQRTKAAHDRQRAEIQERGYFISKAGKKIAKLGNANATASAAGNEIIKKKAINFARKILPVIKDQLGQGKSIRQVADYLNVEGYLTARGGQWHASSVSNILKRAA